MASCTLTIGPHVVARSDGGLLDAEYSLFEDHEIELRSTEPGLVREEGYRTTVALAKERLDANGVTRALADQVASELAPIAAAYAKGPIARRVVALLDSASLLAGGTFEARAKRYAGVWLDVAAILKDAECERAATSLQALHLAAWIDGLEDQTPVVLSTADYTKGRRPGERTFKRVKLTAASGLAQAMHELAKKGAPSTEREGGLTRAELSAFLRARADATADIRAKLTQIERAMAERVRPAKGPLADPDLWGIELRLDAGDTAGIAELIDAIEKARGKQPAFAYLRARAALALGTESPRAVAERMSELAMSMSSFGELELLVARSWTRAGEPHRALPYARDLASNPHMDDAIRDGARQILADAEGPPPQPPAPPVVSAAPPALVAPQAIAPPPPPSAAPPSPAPAPASVRPSSRPAMPATSLGEAIAISHGSQPALELRRPPSHPPPIAPRSAAPAPMPAMRPSSAPPIQPSAIISVTDQLSAPSSGPPAALDANELSPSDRPAAMVGASRPPFQTDQAPRGGFASEPVIPRLPIGASELAEALSLPAALESHAVDLETVPSTVIDARVAFTRLTRMLGKAYRDAYRVELRTDVRGLEVIQRHLKERFPEGLVQGEDAMRSIRMHGAFVSELISRTLGGEWAELGKDYGHLAMRVPPGVLVWPFGRVLRFVEMQHKERDLVSYYLELTARTPRA